VKNFLILHHGFERPTPEDMVGWNRWFASIADHEVQRAGLRGGREISRTGTKDLPFGKDSLTGYTVIRARDLDDAERIARGCPIVSSTSVHEIINH